MGKLERAWNSPSYLPTKIRCCSTHSCSVRTGTNPVLLVRRWSMDLIEPGIKSLKAPRLSQLLKRQPTESMRGPNNADGRRFGWYLDRSLRIRPITNVKETLMICNGR